MALSLAKIEAVYWIHRLGSFQAAAGHLHITQPTVSLRVAELETQLGFKIFHRKGHKVSPTDKGAELLTYAEELLVLTDDMQNRLWNRPTLSGVLRLGAADSFALTCLPPLLRRIKSMYPAMQVDLDVDHSLNLSRALNRRELDLAFLVDPSVESHVRLESICSVRMIWIAGANHKLPKGTVGPEHLHDEELLTLPAPSTTYSMIETWFGRAGLRAKKQSTCNSMNMIVSLAVANCGISTVPQCIVLHELRSGLLRRIQVQPDLPAHSLYAAYQLSRFKSGLREIVAMGRDEVSRHEAFQGAV